MEDVLTKSVIEYQQGKLPLRRVQNLILEAAFIHLVRYRGKGEDEISEFLLSFYDRIESLVARFRFQDVPFSHFLRRSLRWQWNTFQSEAARRQRQELLAHDAWQWDRGEDCLAEPTFPTPEVELPSMSATTRKRLVLLALKSAPYLDQTHLEAVSQNAGVELAWLQACQYRLNRNSEGRRCRREHLFSRRGEALSRRLLAEDEARREADPGRRQIHEWRAAIYRKRLANLNKQQDSLSSAPTHLELANLLGMPKGSVDSGLYHLKKTLALVYIGRHDRSSRHKQPPQETGT